MEYEVSYFREGNICGCQLSTIATCGKEITTEFSDRNINELKMEFHERVVEDHEESCDDCWEERRSDRYLAKCDSDLL